MSTIIKTKYGYVSGIQEDGCTKYLGIPFAKPPVGELSFKHPVEIEEWEGIFHAIQAKANPIQQIGPFSAKNIDQDCLYMNIFVPDTTQKDLPVMVWIYGGSFSEGGSGEDIPDSNQLHTDFSKLCKQLNAIIVSFNYRLNLYGFLNLSYLDERFDANNGLYDQIQALKFVKENISHFNGDMNNITVFGQSAGGACILALMCMEETKEYINKSIIMSACVDHFFSLEESKRNTTMYLKGLEVQEDHLDALFELTPDQIVEANGKYAKKLLTKMDIRCAFSPVVDGNTLKYFPKKAVVNRNLPILMGTTKEEANLFILSKPTPILFVLGKKLGIHLENNNQDYKHRFADAMTKYIYKQPMQEILREYVGDDYTYDYNYTSPIGKTNGMGCYHASDLSVLFLKEAGYGILNDEKSIQVQAKMVGLFNSFIRDTIIEKHYVID